MMESSQTNNKSSRLLYLVFVLILLFTAFLSFSYLQKTNKLNLGNFFPFTLFGKTEKISPHILFLTSPIYSLSGKITKISGNTLWVEQTFQQQALTIPANFSNSTTPPSVPVPITQTITFKVLTDDKTQITKQPANIPFLFKTISTVNQSTTLSLADLKVGQLLNISSVTDLRTAANDTFTASAIQVGATANSIAGKITNINGNTITVKAPQPTSTTLLPPPTTANQPASTPPEKDYTITLTDNTEISRVDSGNNEQFGRDILKPDMLVAVYTDTDTALTTNFPALRIEPNLPLSSPSPPTPPSPPSATPVP